MKRRLGLVFFAMILSVLSIALISCGGETPEIVSIEYDVAGGKLPTDAPTTYERGSAPDFSTVKPTRKNYDFEGWYLDSEHTNRFSDELVTGSAIKLYAKWTAKSFNINFVLDEGTCEGLPDKYTYGTDLSLEQYVPVKSGHIFFGWYFDKDKIVPADVIESGTTDEVTVYAKWNPTPQKIMDIPDMEKVYYANRSNTVIKLSDYINSNGLKVSYSVSVSDPTVATAELNNGEIWLNVLKGSGEAQVTVTASYGGVEYVNDSFTVKPVVYNKVACVGDSNTVGVGLGADEKYTSYLQALLGTDIKVKNYGKDGAAVTEFSNGGSYVTHQEHGRSLEYNADLVIIMLGTNDARRWDESKTVFKQRYTSIVESYKAVNPNVKIVIITSAPVNEQGNKLNIPLENIVNCLRPAQRELASELGAILVEFDGALANIPNGTALFQEDGVHLTRDVCLALATHIKNSVFG